MLRVAVRVPKWECELWDYVSSGDGMLCPKYSNCEKRLMGGWCRSDNLDYLTRLYDEKQFDGRKNDVLTGRVCGDCGGVFQLVERLAQSIVKKGGVQCPPVPSAIVFWVEEQHQVEIRLVPLAVHHGAIWHLQECWIIQLNENDTPARRRFTLFHEAFHILAHSGGTPVFKKRDGETGCFNELLAEYFAGCILMPRKWLEEKWAEVKDLDGMAEIFDVEKPLMWIRLRELHLI